MSGQCNASPEPLACSEFTRDLVTVSLDKLSTNCLCSGIEGNPFSEPQVAHWIQIHLGIGYQRRQPDRSIARWGMKRVRKAEPPLLVPFLHILLAPGTCTSTCTRRKIHLFSSSTNPSVCTRGRSEATHQELQTL